MPPAASDDDRGLFSLATALELIDALGKVLEKVNEENNVEDFHLPPKQVPETTDHPHWDRLTANTPTKNSVG